MPFWLIFSCLASWVRGTLLSVWHKLFSLVQVVEDFLDIQFAKLLSFHYFSPWKLVKQDVLQSSQGQWERATVPHAVHMGLMETSDMGTDVLSLPSCKLAGRCIPSSMESLRGLVFVLSKTQGVKRGAGLWRALISSCLAVLGVWAAGAWPAWPWALLWARLPWHEQSAGNTGKAFSGDGHLWRVGCHTACRNCSVRDLQLGQTCTDS